MTFQPTRKRMRAFTLVEIMVVVVILGILAATIIPQFMGTTHDAKVSAAKAQVAELESAIDRFYVHMDRYPTPEEGFKVLVEAPNEDADKKWRGPYIKQLRDDPWDILTNTAAQERITRRVTTSGRRVKVPKLEIGNATMWLNLSSRLRPRPSDFLRLSDSEPLGSFDVVGRAYSRAKRPGNNSGPARGDARPTKVSHGRSRFFTGNHSAGAFTLIEMMTVMVIIGIVTAMIIPEMRGTFQDTLLRTTARDLVNVIELASSRAISLNQTVRINVDVGSGHYQIERLKREGTMDDFEPLDGIAGASGELDKRVAIQIQAMDDDSSSVSGSGGAPAGSPDSAITFNADGTADAAMILLQDRAGYRLNLRINPVTSRVTILEPTHE